MGGERTTAVAAATTPSRPRHLLGLAASHLLPAVLFGVLAIDKLLLLESAVAVLLHRRLEQDVFYAIDQGLGLVYFLLIAFLYVIRRPRRGGRRGLLVTSVSLFGTFAIIGAGIVPGAPARTELLRLSALMLTAGLAYSLFALAHLGRSLSILPEARRLVTGGPYRFSRHPLYLGEAVAGIGAALPSLSYAGAALVALFLAAQVARMRWEEAVLAGQFPDQYPGYRHRVPMLVPLPWRRP